MRYRVQNLKMFATPKAEKMFEFSGLPQVEFEFEGIVKTVLFIHCGRVRASLQGGKDYYEIVGRLYKSDNPQETGENHVGKLYINVFDHPFNTIFKTSVEKFEWYEDGSFDVITANGERHHITPA